MSQLERKEVDFYGDRLTVARGEDGRTYVSARQVAEALGLDWSTQLKKLRGHPVLAKGIQHFAMPSGRGIQEAVTIRTDLLPMWLVTVHPKKAAVQVVEKLTRYQEEAAQVLAAAFLPSSVPAPTQEVDQLDALAATVELMRRQRDEVRKLATRVDQVEQIATQAASLNSSRTGHFTIRGFANIRKVRVDLAAATRIGKTAAALARSQGVPIPKMEDEVFGFVNAYPQELLAQVFDEHFGRAGVGA